MSTELEFPAPDHLQHKPIIAVEDYHKDKDGIYAGDSDAKVLSIGRAQYDDEEFSAKVLRHKNGKWSRQSEELPLHRVLDLAILLVASNKRATTGQDVVSSLSEKVIDFSSLPDLLSYYKANQNELQPRLDELKRLLS